MKYISLTIQADELRRISILHRFQPKRTSPSALLRKESGSFLERTGSEDFTTHDTCRHDYGTPSQIHEGQNLAGGRLAWRDYDALSYTWGSPPDKKEIIINDEVVKV